VELQVRNPDPYLHKRRSWWRAGEGPRLTGTKAQRHLWNQGVAKCAPSALIAESDTKPCTSALKLYGFVSPFSDLARAALLRSCNLAMFGCFWRLSRGGWRRAHFETANGCCLSRAVCRQEPARSREGLGRAWGRPRSVRFGQDRRL